VLKEFPVITRFLDPANKEPVIDVMRPNDLYRETFKNCVRVGKTHDVPTLELALAAKFAAMVSRMREIPKKLSDASDFAQMVRRNQHEIDFDRLRNLGDAVYPGGGDEIVRFVDDIKAGRMLRL
jgi:predicted RNase H-like nuclease